MCADAIVAEMCKRVNVRTGSYWMTEADKNKSIVHASELASMFMVSRDSVINYFSSLQLRNMETNLMSVQKGAYAVNCMDLCHRTVNSIPEAFRPNVSDVGCRFKAVSNAYVCDMDLRPSTLGQIRFKQLNKSAAQKELGESPGSSHVHKRPRGKARALAKASISELLAMGYPNVTNDDLRLSVSQLFRVFPATKVQFDFKSTPPKHGVKSAQTMTGSSASRQGGTSSASLAQVDLAMLEAVDDTVEIGEKALGVVNQALSKMGARSLTDVVIKFFGTNDEDMRSKVKRVLNGVKQALANVKYQYPGEACDDGTVAYVDSMPEEMARDRDSGAWIVRLCNMFFDVSMTEEEKIRTLVHECAHHLPMDTDDVVYGYTATVDLAKSSPNKAVDNAENICYFVSDAAQLAGGDPAQASPDGWVNVPVPVPTMVPEQGAPAGAPMQGEWTEWEVFPAATAHVAEWAASPAPQVRARASAPSSSNTWSGAAPGATAAATAEAPSVTAPAPTPTLATAAQPAAAARAAAVAPAPASASTGSGASTTTPPPAAVEKKKRSNDEAKSLLGKKDYAFAKQFIGDA